MPDRLDISGFEDLWHDHGAGAKPRSEFRAPIVSITPFPFEWWGESESVRDPMRAPGFYVWEIGGERTLVGDDLIAVRAEYPLIVSIDTDGPYVFAGDDVLALAEEFERASADDRFDRPWRMGLAARLMRRFAGRSAVVSIPGL